MEITGLEFSRKTLREQIVGILRKKIFNGEIKPGERIKEMELAEAFQVSRGPIREALRQIEQEGLIEYAPHKGCVVRTLTLDNINEVYLIRSDLECLAVRLFGGKMSESGIKGLEKAVHEIGNAAKERDLYRIVRWDEEFHSIIVSEARSQRLKQMWGFLEGENAATYYTMNEEELMPMDYLERNHRIILDEIRVGTIESICRIIEEHYMVVPATLHKKRKEEGKKA